MSRIDQIMRQYNDAIYCSNMLGGEDGETRAREGFETFKKNITAAAKSGLTKEESKSLLEKTIGLNSKAFLIALSVCNDFDSFSTLLDNLKTEMIALANPKTADLQRGVEYFFMVMSANTSHLPGANDFALYQEMRLAMLKISDSPDDKVMCEVVTQFKDKFVDTDNSKPTLQCRIM